MRIPGNIRVHVLVDGDIQFPSAYPPAACLGEATAVPSAKSNSRIDLQGAASKSQSHSWSARSQVDEPAAVESIDKFWPQSKRLLSKSFTCRLRVADHAARHYVSRDVEGFHVLGQPY